MNRVGACMLATAIVLSVAGGAITLRGFLLERAARDQRNADNRAVLVRLCEATKAHDAADAADSTKLATIDSKFASASAVPEFQKFLRERSQIIVKRALRFKALADVDCSKLATGS